MLLRRMSLGWIFDRDPKRFTLYRFNMRWRVIFAMLIYSIYILYHSITSISFPYSLTSILRFYLLCVWALHNTLFSFQSCSIEQQITAIESIFGIHTICRDWHVEAWSESVRLPKCESRKGLWTTQSWKQRKPTLEYHFSFGMSCFQELSWFLVPCPWS